MLLLAAIVPARSAAAPPADAAREVREAVSRVEKRYRALTSFKISFSQRYTSATFGAQDEAQGTVFVVPPARMLWIYDKPAGQKGALDGNQYWLIDPEDREVRLRQRVEGGVDPVTDLLAGRLELGKLFEVELSADPAPPGRVLLLLIPKTPREDMERATLEVERADGTARRLEIIDPVGGQFEYRLGPPQAAPPPPDSAFRLVVPEGFATTRD